MSKFAAEALKYLNLPIAKPAPLNLYEILQRLPRNGQGAKLRPVSYKDREFYDGKCFKIISANFDFKNLKNSQIYLQLCQHGKLRKTGFAVVTDASARKPWEFLEHFKEDEILELEVETLKLPRRMTKKLIEGFPW